MKKLYTSQTVCAFLLPKKHFSIAELQGGTTTFVCKWSRFYIRDVQIRLRVRLFKSSLRAGLDNRLPHKSCFLGILICW